MMKAASPRHQQASRASSSSAAALPRVCRLSNGRPQEQRAIAACAAPSDSNPCSTSGRSIDEARLRGVDRRALLGATLTLSAAGALGLAPASQAFVEPPQGFRVWTDKLDGYQFVYPDSWLAVTVTGNDCFFRNPRNVDENLFVDISSPSSSFYQTVTDLGTPDQTAKQILSQYLDKEFMSTRIGIRREGQILSASSRQGEDGRTYFDVAIRMTSYASRSPYLATQGEVLKDYGIEWDRVLLTTLGVANNRLYELRLQTAQATLDKSLPVLQQISQSFSLREVEKA